MPKQKQEAQQKNVFQLNLVEKLNVHNKTADTF